MKKIYPAAMILLLISMVLSCQTMKVQEAPKVAGPEGVYLAATSTPNGDIEFTLAINEDGSGYTESQMGRAEFRDAKIEGNSFSFDMTIPSQMGEMALTFNGAVDGDTIGGNINTQMGEMPFSGQRK
jgi:hypothetical protein